MKRYLTLVITLAVATSITLNPFSAAVAEAPVVEVVKKLEPKEYAKAELERRGYPDKNWVCLENLWQKESNWRPLADNKESSAFGIAQMLNEKSTNPYKQIDNGLAYIEYRYGNPCAAWQAWLVRDKKGIGWY